MKKIKRRHLNKSTFKIYKEIYEGGDFMKLSFVIVALIGSIGFIVAIVAFFNGALYDWKRGGVNGVTIGALIIMIVCIMLSYWNR